LRKVCGVTKWESGEFEILLNIDVSDCNIVYKAEIIAPDKFLKNCS
jgi:hypothetical protein